MFFLNSANEYTSIVKTEAKGISFKKYNFTKFYKELICFILDHFSISAILQLYFRELWRFECE